jgi:hypothetical protein
MLEKTLIPDGLGDVVSERKEKQTIIIVLLFGVNLISIFLSKLSFGVTDGKKKKRRSR